MIGCKFPCFDCRDDIKSEEFEDFVYECLLTSESRECLHLIKGGTWNTCTSGGKSRLFDSYCDWLKKVNIMGKPISNTASGQISNRIGILWDQGTKRLVKTDRSRLLDLDESIEIPISGGYQEYAYEVCHEAALGEDSWRPGCVDGDSAISSLLKSILEGDYSYIYENFEPSTITTTGTFVEVSLDTPRSNFIIVPKDMKKLCLMGAAGISTIEGTVITPNGSRIPNLFHLYFEGTTLVENEFEGPGGLPFVLVCRTNFLSGSDDILSVSLANNCWVEVGRAVK